MNYYSLNQYLRATYGRKLYKLSLNAGFSCPNRDGTLSTGGCIFCSAGGSGEFAGNDHQSITQQIEEGKAKLAHKMKTPKSAQGLPSYIAYFQAYTNTYAPISQLESVFQEALSHPDIAILSIATRPDCLGPEILALLDRLNQIKPVWVELGLQTIHENTALFLNRGYETPVYDQAVFQLQQLGILCVTHVILGLPGETPDMMYQTVRHVAEVGSWGIKLQLLHVLRNTKLAELYEKHLFDTLTLPQYLDLLQHCLALLPPDMVVHRVTGDGPKSLLIAPLWTGDKKKVLNAIAAYPQYSPLSW